MDCYEMAGVVAQYGGSTTIGRGQADAIIGKPRRITMRIRATSVIQIVFVAIALASTPARGEQDSVRLCFAADDTISCQPAIATYPHEFQVYLVLSNCSSTGGVGGWEATVDLSDGLMFGSADLGTGAINSGSDTTFYVAYSSPRAQSSTIILATLTLIATGPGCIYLHAFKPSSMPDSFSPVYADGTNPSRLVEMRYQVGSPFHPVLTIGLPECPAPIAQSHFLPSMPDTAAVPPQIEEYTESSTAPEAPTQKCQLTDIDVDKLTGHSAIVARTRLLDKSKHFVLVNNIRTGLAELKFKIEELYCGPQIDTIIVFARGVDFPGKLRYDRRTRFAKYEDLEEGGEALVSATLVDNVFWTHDSRVFPLSADSENDARDQLSALREREFQLRPPQQAMEADLVALVLPAHQPGSYDVVAVYHGEHSQGPIRLSGWDNDYIQSALSKATGQSSSALCFLEHLAGEEYRLLAGARSVFVAGTGSMLDHSGYAYSLRSFSSHVNAPSKP